MVAKKEMKASRLGFYGISFCIRMSKEKLGKRVGEGGVLVREYERRCLESGVA